MAEAEVRLDQLVEDTAAEIDALARLGTASGDRTQRRLFDSAAAMLSREIDASLRAACQTNLLGLLLDGWAQIVEVRHYGDPTLTPSGHPVHVTLGEHPLEIDVDPGLTLVVPGVASYRLDLILAVVAHVKSALLVIEQGRIVAVGTG